MVLDIYMGSRFNRSHENEAFCDLIKIVTDELPNQDVALIGNFSCAGYEMDALLVKRDAIIIIDFKNYEGQIDFNLNGDWRNESNVVKGGGHVNPYWQIKKYKQGLMGWLTTNKMLLPNEPVTHISGLVLFQGRINLQGEVISRALSYWFGVHDFSSVGTWLSQRASPSLNLSKDRILNIVSQLGVRPYEERQKVLSLYKQRRVSVASELRRQSTLINYINADDFDSTMRI